MFLSDSARLVGLPDLRIGPISLVRLPRYQALADYAVIVSVLGSSFRLPCTGGAFS